MHRYTLILALLSLPLGAHAEEFHEQHAVHVHGITALEIARDANQLELALHSPAYNLVGFEHMPSNDIQRNRVSEVMGLLKNPEAFISLESKARCELVKVELENPLTGDLHDHEEDQDHRAKHEHEHESKSVNHSDIQAHYHYRCANTQALQFLEIDLFSHFPLIDEIQAQIITEYAQREQQLTPGNNRIPLSD